MLETFGILLVILWGVSLWVTFVLLGDLLDLRLKNSPIAITNDYRSGIAKKNSRSEVDIRLFASISPHGNRTSEAFSISPECDSLKNGQTIAITISLSSSNCSFEKVSTALKRTEKNLFSDDTCTGLFTRSQRTAEIRGDILAE